MRCAARAPPCWHPRRLDRAAQAAAPAARDGRPHLPARHLRGQAGKRGGLLCRVHGTHRSVYQRAGLHQIPGARRPPPSSRTRCLRERAAAAAPHSTSQSPVILAPLINPCRLAIWPPSTAAHPGKGRRAAHVRPHRGVGERGGTRAARDDAALHQLRTRARARVKDHRAQVRDGRRAGGRVGATCASGRACAGLSRTCRALDSKSALDQPALWPVEYVCMQKLHHCVSNFLEDDATASSRLEPRPRPTTTDARQAARQQIDLLRRLCAHRTCIGSVALRITRCSCS